MKLYAFASDKLVNIWAGVGAQMWAVPSSSAKGTDAGRRAKAAKINLGAAGIFYSSRDKCFTSPFLIHSSPDPNAVVEHIWDGPWILPFAIRTIGDPHLRLGWEEAKQVLPSCREGTPLHKLIHVQPLTVFAGSDIAAMDWAALIKHLTPSPQREEGWGEGERASARVAG